MTWLTKRCGRRVPCECRTFRPSLWFPSSACLAHERPAALTLARGLEYFLLCAGDLVPHQMCRAPTQPTDPHLVPPPSVPSPRPSSISRFLKSVDKFNDRVISAYVTATRDWPLSSPLLHLQLLHASRLAKLPASVLSLAYTINLCPVSRISEQAIRGGLGTSGEAVPLLIICYRGTADVKFMLLHDGKSEDNVRSFFTEVHELYLKVLAHTECTRSSQM